MEYGDASGTACWMSGSASGRRLLSKQLGAELAEKLPPLISSDKPAGTLQASTAKSLEFESGSAGKAPEAATT